MWSPFVLSKQTEPQLADFTQLFFGQALTGTANARWSKRHDTSPSSGGVCGRGRGLVSRRRRHRLRRSQPMLDCARPSPWAARHHGMISRFKRPARDMSKVVVGGVDATQDAEFARILCGVRSSTISKVP
ncbi:hypothetical protein E0H63_29975 [Rhizobium leguminosarum bv. viciae]|nr:hypothetical protein E0H63_29975 [Rhizobium leguminosarum bv. viciae]